MAIDFVCKMEIDEEAVSYSSNYEDEEYFFCSEGCLEEFKRRPLDYIEPDSTRPGVGEDRDV